MTNQSNSNKPQGYILIGLSDYADDLLQEGYDYLKQYIGFEIIKSDEPSPVDGGDVFLMPDGKTAHSIFLLVKKNPIQDVKIIVIP